MTPRRIVLTGAVGVLLLLAASLALLNWLDSPALPAALRWDASAPAGTPVVAAPEVLPASPALPNVVAEPLPIITAPDIGARPSAAAIVPWDLVPIASRLGELGPGLAAPVNTALKSARATIESCFEEDRQLRASRPAPPYDPENVPTGPAVLVLQLESRAGALDVVAATVESLGTSTKELAECACQVLRGWPIPAPGATAGRRYRLKYSLL
jgi:hypothetical protein